MAIKKVTLLSLDNADESQLDNLYSLGSEVVNGRKKSVKVAMSLLRGNTAFREWQERNPGKTYADWIALLQEPAQDAADGIDQLKDDLTEFGKGMVLITETGKKVIEATEQVKSDTNTVKEATEQVKADTLAMKEATDKVRKETLSVKEATEQVKSDTNTVKEATEQVKADTLAMKEATDKVRKETLSVKEATEQVKSDTNTVKEATEKVRTDTLSVKAITMELNAHPMCIRGGIWYQWSIEKHDYETTGIQAQGKTGTSFKIIGRYDTYEELIAAVPDGSDVDGVYAIGAVEPFSYYAWIVVDGTWCWDNQGKLRGAEGKSSYEVWLEIPGNEGKPIKDYFISLSPYVGENLNWWVGSEDTGYKAPGTDAHSPYIHPDSKNWVVFDDESQEYKETDSLAEGVSVEITEAVKTPNEYRFHVKHAKGEFTTPNLMGRSGTAVLDIDHEPTADDNTYVYNDVEYPFSVGQEVRFKDQDSGEFVFFKCYDNSIKGGAIWEEIGSGGALPFNVYLSPATDYDNLTPDVKYITNNLLND